VRPHCPSRRGQCPIKYQPERALIPYRHVDLLPGRVLSVSADSITEERTGRTYYLARVDIAQGAAQLPDGITLQAACKRKS
jgi:hypothetical protein